MSFLAYSFALSLFFPSSFSFLSFFLPLSSQTPRGPTSPLFCLDDDRCSPSFRRRRQLYKFFFALRSCPPRRKNNRPLRSEQQGRERAGGRDHQHRRSPDSDARAALCASTAAALCPDQLVRRLPLFRQPGQRLPVSVHRVGPGEARRVPRDPVRVPGHASGRARPAASAAGPAVLVAVPLQVPVPVPAGELRRRLRDAAR